MCVWEWQTWSVKRAACACVCACVGHVLEHTQFEHVARAEEQLQRHICRARYISGLSLRDTEARYRSGLCHFSWAISIRAASLRTGSFNRSLHPVLCARCCGALPVELCMHVIGILLCARARMVPVCVYMTHLDRFAPNTVKHHLCLEHQFLLQNHEHGAHGCINALGGLGICSVCYCMVCD